MKLDRDKLIRAREMLGYAIETVAEDPGGARVDVTSCLILEPFGEGA